MTFSPAGAVTRQRDQLVDARDRLTALHSAIGYSHDLSLDQCAQWFAAVLDFRPDLVLELGRHFGNSTAVFTEAANRLPDCRVVSLCLTSVWQETTAGNMARVVPPDWFDRLDARTGNMLSVDPAQVIGDARRVLVLWDAHGFQVASWVLGALAPVLAPREHLIIMHDITDTRFNPGASTYGSQGLWTGGNGGPATIQIDHMSSPMEQLVSALDFTSRNHIELQSAEESFRAAFSASEADALAAALGPLFSMHADWFWFSLNDVANPTFPVYKSPGEQTWSDWLGALWHQGKHFPMERISKRVPKKLWAQFYVRWRRART